MLFATLNLAPDQVGPNADDDCSACLLEHGAY